MPGAVWALGSLGRPDFLGRAGSGETFISQDALHPTVLPWEDAQDVARRLPDVLERLTFTAPVTEAMARVRAALGTSERVAYHLRRGDIIAPETEMHVMYGLDHFLIIILTAADLDLP